MQSLLTQPWPWYVSGPLIGLMVPLLLYAGNKPFGISSSMRHICAMCVPVRVRFFDYDWRKESWSLLYVAGILLGSFLAGYVFRNPDPIAISEAAGNTLNSFGISDHSGFVPNDVFNLPALATIRGLIIMILGGFCVGFGTRYANGCTSGHTITGLSALNLSSLVATICFFVGGLIINWFVLPILFRL